jgi:hypothetical protein
LSYYVSEQKPVGAPPVTPKGRGGGRTQNLMIILKILRICNLNLKINLKITVELKMFSHFVKFWLNKKFFFCNFLWICPVPDLRVKNVLSNSEFPVYCIIYLLLFFTIITTFMNSIINKNDYLPKEDFSMFFYKIFRKLSA